jgi:PAS domain S-box-containing protein
MGETENKPSGNKHPSVVQHIFDNSERLLQFFSRTSAIGFAILDNQLRYLGINNCLANINGMPAKDHLGFSVREIFGELSEKIAEPSYHRVLDLGQTSHFEIKNAVVPTRADSRFWGLNTNFPLWNRAGKVRGIGILVVDVTEQRKLEHLLNKLAADLRHTKPKETFWQARHLRESISQYHAALEMSLDGLIGDREKSAELLAQSIEVLDQRIKKMGALVSSVTSSFPIVK